MALQTWGDDPSLLEKWGGVRNRGDRGLASVFNHPAFGPRFKLKESQRRLIG